MGFLVELLLALILLPFFALLIANLISQLISWHLTTKFGIKVKLTSIGWFYVKGITLTLPSHVHLEIKQIKLESGLQQLALFLLSRYRKDAFIKVRASAINLTTANYKLAIESLSLEHEDARSSIALRNSHITSLSALVNNELEAKHKILAISQIKMIINRKLRERNFIINDECYLSWHPAFHLELLELIDEIKKIWASIRAEKTIQDQEQVVPTPPDSPSHQNWSLINLKIAGDISIGALVSNVGQTISIKSSGLTMVMPARNRMVLKGDEVFLDCDGNAIVTGEQLLVQLVPDSEGHKFVDRTEMGPNLLSKKNSALLVQFNSVKVAFPYQYNFADTFNQRFITMTKWLRQLHQKRNQQTNLPNGQASKHIESDSHESKSHDLNIRIGHFLMDIGDDPFETKLRNNFELLDDETVESEKRRKMLNEKVGQLKRTKFLSDAKLDELYEALAKKDADIYIQRHKQLYSTPVGTRHKLLTVVAEDIDIQAAADETMTGYDKLFQILTTKLDKESPVPPDLRFSTIWCRQLHATIRSLSCRLRDFPRPFMEIEDLLMQGTLMGAEQEAAPRARRTAWVDLGPTRESEPVERSMPSLKFYHDLRMKTKHWHYTHGACWEPVLSQLSLSFELISRPSVDPSPTLPWWDKMRFLFHGSLHLDTDNLSIFFHGSLDPYNTTELIQISFNQTLIGWLTGKIRIRADADLLIHTASKYDECRIVHLPRIDGQIYLNWICVANQYDHHSVMPCAKDKVLVPEYSINQVHDTYRAFRSQNLSVKISIESKPQLSSDPDDIPSLLLYGSSLRWFDQQKQIFSGITRLTRRGILFKNTKPRKVGFSRIFRKIRVAVHLHKFRATYWSSFNRTYGLEIIGGPLSHSGEHSMTLVPYDDEPKLARRPRPDWSLTYMNTEVSDVEIWLHNNQIPPSAADLDPQDKAEKASQISSTTSSRNFLLNITRVSYNRENKDHTLNSSSARTNLDDSMEDPPTHRLIVHDLKGAWTKSNKDVVLTIYDNFCRAQQLKRNLSTEALKLFAAPGASGQSKASASGTTQSPQRHHRLSTTSPATTINRGHAASMLQKLIQESELNPNVVYTEDVESELISEEAPLKGVQACQDTDLQQRQWLIELINSQVMLRGCETRGYVIASAAKTQIWQKIHRPVWKERTLYAKRSWVGSVECMQYYATVDAQLDNDIVWLTVDNIQPKGPMSTVATDLPDLVGSSQPVGGVVSETILSGTAPPVVLAPTGDGLTGSLLDELDMDAPTPMSAANCSTVQLQRIISRCSCQFFYAGFTDDIDEDLVTEVPPLPSEDDDPLGLDSWDNEIAVDSFTLMHNELDISTNSQQFEMIIDLVNNLLLFVEPHRKESAEKLQEMRFQFFLNPIEDQKGPIAKLQDQLRKLIAMEKQRERDCYLIKRILEESKDLREEAYENHKRELSSLEQAIDDCKAEINELNEELQIMISCFKESQITADKTRERNEQMAGGNFVASVVKRIEVCFKQASWRLTDSDGQIGLADMLLSNFLYNKIAKNDDSVEHTLELGYICVQNLLPNQAYQTVLQPTELRANIPLDRRRALRIFCRERAPVAGISVKEHFEVNVIPLTIGVTHAFFKKMLAYFFPEPQEDKFGESTRGKKPKPNRQKSYQPPSSSNSVSSQSLTVPGSEADLLMSSAGASILSASTRSKKGLGSSMAGADIQKMRERAQRNQTFVYIKIPEVPIRVSYKGNKQKNIEDITNFSLILPTIEYHNQTWTWLDVLMAIKNESRTRLLSQAVKQKLHFRSAFNLTRPQQDGLNHEHEPPEPVINEQVEDERKARMLLGNLSQDQKPSTSKARSLASIFKIKK